MEEGSKNCRKITRYLPLGEQVWKINFLKRPLGGEEKTQVEKGYRKGEIKEKIKKGKVRTKKLQKRKDKNYMNAVKYM